MKTRPDNNVTDHIGAVYGVNKIELSWLMGLSAICDEYQVAQWRDVRIEPLKAWHDVINLEFISYLMMFQFHSYLSLFHVLYFMRILICVFYIVRDLGTLGVAQKI